ncbi:hypothetical protein BCR32DRAFT_289393 [Anaeromyces robustus]|uniref:Cyclin N-terminal domain-containing protein n=1 Tax=Anaeromyces robustus TaxID=1754192 RepID=A0A1Y1XNW7_9FUNG|nr:hypothetical protein BCR32DRAFT_289393 [Anaeromyces robustus]|eukprot:ORX87423.1 hypothetical protein BCR32DRAFT_289393 [Anaeromyces robustus]
MAAVTVQRNEIENSNKDKLTTYTYTITQSYFIDSLYDIACTILNESPIWNKQSSTNQESLCSLRSFIVKITESSNTTITTFQVALYYLLQLHRRIENINETQKKQKLYTALCGRRMFLAALIIASKYATDRALSSGTWATHIIGQNNGIRNVTEVNSIQQEFLSIMEYELFIEYENFNHWMDELKEYTILKYKYLSTNDQKQALQWKTQQSYWFKRLSIAANMKHSKLNSITSSSESCSSSPKSQTSSPNTQSVTTTPTYIPTPSSRPTNQVGNPFLVFYQNKATSLPSPTSPVNKKFNTATVVPIKQNISVPVANINNNTSSYPRYIQRGQIPNYVINNNATLTPLSNISTPYVSNKSSNNVASTSYIQSINNNKCQRVITNCNNKRSRSSYESYPLEKKIKYSNQVIPTPPSNSRMFININ